MFYNAQYAHSEDNFHHFTARPVEHGAGVRLEGTPHNERAFRKALRRHIAKDNEWDALLTRTRDKGKALGIKNVADVERLSDEYWRNNRR